MKPYLGVRCSAKATLWHYNNDNNPKEVESPQQPALKISAGRSGNHRNGIHCNDWFSGNFNGF